MFTGKDNTLQSIIKYTSNFDINKKVVNLKKLVVTKQEKEYYARRFKR